MLTPEILLVLYLLLATLAYSKASSTIRRSRRIRDGTWHEDLARMTQVSLVGFGVGGAFLGLAYFDLLYNIYAIIVLNHLILEKALAASAEQAGDAPEPSKPPAPGVRVYGPGGRLASRRG